MVRKVPEGYHGKRFWSKLVSATAYTGKCPLHPAAGIICHWLHQIWEHASKASLLCMCCIHDVRMLQLLQPLPRPTHG
eukprot:358996-Chlamydomonas_euryale.AAC.10